MGTRGWAYRRRQPEGTVLYEAVRDNLATLLAEASEVGRGMPRYVERDFARYLECGVLAHGFARVRCESCKDELLVAFSCKGRGVCPSCNAKRAHVTAEHLVERVLPHVPYRQWTLSFPHRVRWVLLKDVGLLSDVLTLFLRAGARPAAPKGTAAGLAWWAGRGRVFHPVLRLRLASDASLPLAGAGRRLHALHAGGGWRTLRAVAAAHAR
ncbi:hypothetical protein F0U61_15170 [Archangium violaceum]|nr:hypothetical protein F0U61_15170 [Archangium violaceum]